MKDSCSRLGRTLLGYAIPLSALALLCAVPFTADLNAQNATKPHRKVVVAVQPDYPAVLKNARFEGQVRLEATVLPNGSVSNVEVKGGNPMLAQYASQAVMKWKYAPGPDRTLEEVVFNFNAVYR